MKDNDNKLRLQSNKTTYDYVYMKLKVTTPVRFNMAIMNRRKKNRWNYWHDIILVIHIFENNVTVLDFKINKREMI